MTSADSNILTETGLEADVLIGALGRMLLIRRFEECAQKLFTQGRLPGFVHLYIGQEAVAVGACTALRPEDLLVAACCSGDVSFTETDLHLHHNRLAYHQTICFWRIGSWQRC